MNWKIWTAFLSIFVAGAFAGAVGVGVYMKFHFGKHRTPEDFRAKMESRLYNDIVKEVRPAESALPEIKAAIGRVLDELHGIHEESRPRIKAAFEKGRKEIESHLTPEEIERFNDLREKRRKGDFGFFRLPPPPPPPPMRD